jgi:biotin operon repressor
MNTNQIITHMYHKYASAKLVAEELNITTEKVWEEIKLNQSCRKYINLIRTFYPLSLEKELK